MPFEDNDIRIQEAANQHHPAYDEKAWDKMEKLLNKHLPVKKKDRRRIVFWLFLLMLTTGGAVYLLVNYKERKKDTATLVNKKQVEISNPENETTNKYKDNVSEIASEKKSENSVDKLNIPSTLTENKAANKLPAIKPYPSLNKKRPEPIILLSRKPTLKNKALTNAGRYSNPFSINQTEIPATHNKNVPDYEVKNKSVPNVDLTPAINNTTTISTTPKKDIEEKKLSAENTQDSKVTPAQVEPISEKLNKNEITAVKDTLLEKKSKSKLAKTKKSNSFFFSFSAGPESVKVSSNPQGEIKPVYGIGIGYTFKNRVSVQTGFYAIRKIYTAAGKDYKAPDWWWQYYPNMQKIEAVCKVYEIPLSVSYHFIENKKGNFYGLMGLSSYLMKKEDYTYHYKTNAGQYRVSSYTFNNEYKHFLSTLTIGAGYERKLNSTISLTLSPYLKIPLSGVGFGKVKLNSSGILFSAVIKPFKHKE